MLESSQITEPQAVKKIVVYNKTCPFCKKSFTSTSRNTKFCTPEHREFYNTRRSKSKIFRDENKTLFRFKARAHAMAVDILRARHDQLGLIPQCRRCFKKEGGEEKIKLETHHEDKNFLNNSPENLGYLCVKCHHEEHKVKLTRDELIASAGEDFVLMFESIYSFRDPFVVE